MQFLTKIDETAVDSYTKCIAGLESRYAGVTSVIDAACSQYEKLAGAHTLHLMPRSDDICIGLCKVTGDEMRSLYKNKFALRGSPGRDLYDKIKLLTTKCPLCRIGRVRELDHYLPKKHFPALSVCPSNLIPVCKDCNYDKRTQLPTSQEEVWPHPYFDDIQNEKWLRAELVQNSKPEVVFSVFRPARWDESKFKRLWKFFHDLELDFKYSLEAGAKLPEIAEMVVSVLDEEGPEGAQKFLKRLAASIARTNQNHWEAVFYEGLAINEWYYRGGVRSFLK